MIVSISFLVAESERKRVECKGGKFTLTRNSGKLGRGNASKTFTAKKFVEFVKDRDPYISLEDGTRMRVYRGGDSTDVVIETISLVESHDEKYNVRAREETQPIIPEYPDYSDYGW